MVNPMEDVSNLSKHYELLVTAWTHKTNDKWVHEIRQGVYHGKATSYTDQHRKITNRIFKNDKVQDSKDVKKDFAFFNYNGSVNTADNENWKDYV